jgi:hypothetical protein
MDFTSRESLQFKQDGIKDYYKTGEAARDYYKRALKVSAEEIALSTELQNWKFGDAQIEAWYSETTKLIWEEKVRPTSLGRGKGSSLTAR